jgi:PAS domain S-box-containing protein
MSLRRLLSRFLAPGGRSPRGREGGEAEQRASENEARLALALEAARMATWELDLATGAMTWSPEARRLFGPAHESPGERLPEVLGRFHPDDRAAAEGAIAGAMARPGESHRVEVRALAPDGAVRWLEARGQAWTGPDGAVRGLRGTLLDVTERKRAEEGLERNLRELRVLSAVAEVAVTSRDEATLLGETTRIIRDAFFPDNCGFLLLDEVSGVLTHAPSFHTRTPRVGTPGITVGVGIAGKVAATGVSRRVDDVRGDPDYVPLETGMRSEICVPLRAGTRLLGVLDAESVSPSAFGAEDERLLALVASHVAIALERLRSRTALVESEELYRAYFTASPVGVFVSDTRGRYLEVNGAACAMTGYSREELLSMSISELLVADEGGDQRERLVGLLALGTGRNEIRIRRRDGAIRHCLVHASAVGSDRLLGLLLDITDRQEAEERVRDSEERFRSLSEASFEAILVHDGGRIVDVNQALCDLGGYSWHELVGRNAFELIASEDHEKVYRNLLVEYDKPYEIAGLRRDGSRMALEVRARSFPYRGQILRVVALRDVSERRRAEAIRESLIQELELKNTELERFASKVSHDLKAPLITMRGFLGYLERDLREGRADRLTADVARVVEASGQMQSLLDELLALARAGLPAGPPAPVAIAEVVRDAAAAVEGRLRSRGIQLSTADELPVVRGDRPRLVQVFQSLLDNAAKFIGSRPDGAVRVEARPGADGTVTLVVRDNGVGIDRRHHTRVFEAFEKLDPRAEGMGMGLAVVRRIVEAHGGRVWIESDGLGAGTAVCVTLREAVGEGPGETAPPPVTAAGRRPRE